MGANGKSVLTNISACICSGGRSIINGGGATVPVTPITDILSDGHIIALTSVRDFYGTPMANKQYEAISSNYQQYIDLYVLLTNLQDTVQNPNLQILIQLARDTLIGAVNSYSIYGDNMALQLTKSSLQTQINDILSNKNQKLLEVASCAGQLSITKSFTLAPIFNYYILIYGLPTYGVGFDPLKISFLTNTLKRVGINPYK